MSRTLFAVVLASALCAPGAALAEQFPELGKYEYYSKCAPCHGMTGKGEGSVSSFLVKRPPDLTTYAKRNGGAFPTQLAWGIIDGRSGSEIGPHGTREMPIWGQEYRREILRTGGPEGPNPEWYVAGRVTALLDYLASLQAK